MIKEFEESGLTKVNIWQLFDYGLCKFDQVLTVYCTHLCCDKDIKEALQYTQNTSVLLFFILVHVPLTKVSAAWSFLTGFLCWFLDEKTKEKIYHGCAFFTRILTEPLETYKSYRNAQKVDTLDMGRDLIRKGELTKKDRGQLKNIIDWVCLNVFLFFAILFNYIYVTLLHDFTLTMTSRVI